MLPIPVDWTERVANLFLKTLQKILKTVFVKYISYLIYNFSLTFTTTALKKVNKFSPYGVRVYRDWKTHQCGSVIRGFNIIIPCRANTTNNSKKRETNIYDISSCTKDIAHAKCRFDDFITFLYLFMNVVKIFVR